MKAKNKIDSPETDALLRPFIDSIEATGEALRPFGEAMEQVRIAFDEWKSSYDKSFEASEAALKKNSVWLPMDFEEYKDWICNCAFPDEPFGEVLRLGVQPHHFKLFHEFKMRQFESNGEWTFVDENIRLNDILRGKPAIPGIASKLHRWIGDATDKTLSEIILNNRLPEGSKRPIWKGSVSEAFFFLWWCGIKTAGEFLSLFKFEGMTAAKMNKQIPLWKRAGDTDKEIIKWAQSKKDNSKNQFYTILLKIEIPKK